MRSEFYTWILHLNFTPEFYTATKIILCYKLAHKEEELNFIMVFADKSVTATEKQNKWQ